MANAYHIRYLHKNKEKSLRSIAKETGHDFKTVKKYAKKEDFNEPRPEKRNRKTKRGVYKAEVKSWIEENLSAPRKQRYTAKRIYVILLEKYGEDLTISERTTRTLVKEIKAELQLENEVYVPLTHPKGEAQVDFGETQFYENSQWYKGHHLVLTLPYSNYRLCQLYKSEDSTALFEGLKTMFEYMGGVPRTIRFDNMSTAVAHIGKHGDRKETEMMQRFKLHYGFNSVYCNRASGNEKGSVENAVGYIRRNYFVPVPKMNGLKTYNKALLKRLDKELENTHYQKKVQVKTLFKEEKPKLLPLPVVPFNAVIYKTLKPDKYGFVSIKQVKYSTSGDIARKSVVATIGVYAIDIHTLEGEFITSHTRRYQKGDRAIKWAPYLITLSKKPKAIPYSGFYEDMPEPLKAFIDLGTQSEKQEILQFIAEHCGDKNLDELIDLMSQALALSEGGKAEYLTALSYVMGVSGEMPKNGVPKLKSYTMPYLLDTSVYGKLIPEVGAHGH